MAPFFSLEAEDLKPWSNSKLSTLEKCPYKFNLQYIERVRESDIPEELTAKVDRTATKFGSAAHRLTELVAQGSSVEGAFSQTKKEEKLTKQEADLLDTHLDDATFFERRMTRFKEKYNIVDDRQEVGLAVSDKLTPAKYRGYSSMLRGKIDRLLISEDGKTAIVIDLKTSKRATLQYAEGQLDFYTTLVFGSFPEVQTVRQGLYFLTLGEMLWAPTARRISYKMDGENSIVKRVNGAVSDFCTQKVPEIRVHTLCKWCIYREVCKKERRARRAASKA